MKNILFLFVCLHLAIGLVAQKNHVSGQLIVQLDGGNIKSVLHKVNKLLDGTGFKVEEGLSEGMNIWLISYPESLINVDMALEIIKTHTNVVVAQVNHTDIEIRSNSNDTDFSSQWCHVNSGAGGGVAGADMDSDLAWDITTGGVTANNDTIVVAVIDGGFDTSHEDLDFWINRDEIPGNGIDDDANGYIDDINGWNVYDNNGNITPGGSWDSHATHVAGIIGAKGNNCAGVAGVNMNVKIMGIKGSSTSESELVKSYGYVIEMRRKYNESGGTSGAYVVATNSSFGVDNANPDNYPIWCGLYDSLGAVGVLSAVAGPNQGNNIDLVGDVPGACPSNHTISVTNTKKDDTRNGGAGYGLVNCDIGAPGTDINSTIPFGAYSEKTGTSMATPQVAGAVALMYAAACEDLLNDYSGNPAGLALKIKELMLTQGYDSIASMQGESVTGGRLNLHKSLLAVQSYSSCNIVLAGDVNNNSVFDSNEYAGDFNLNNMLDVIEISGDVNGNGTIDKGEKCGDNNGNKTLEDAEFSGDVNGNGTIDTLEYLGDTDGSGYFNNGEVVGDKNGNKYIDCGEVLGDANNDGVVDSTDVAPVGPDKVYLQLETPEVSEKIEFSVYPNPATNILNLSFNNYSQSAVTAVIYNVMGAKVLEQQIYSSSVQLDVHALNNGMYFLYVMDDEGTKQTSKFLISR